MDLSLPIEEPVLEFTVLVLAALLVQLMFRKLPVPALIGLLLVGMLIGPGAGNILAPDMAVELLGSVGLLYIMFLAGLEIDLDVVRPWRSSPGQPGATRKIGGPILAVVATGATPL